jgi:hypothetical protein
MFKKILLIIIVGMLVVSGVQAVTIKDSSSDIQNITEKVTFSEQLIIAEKGDYLSVDLEDADLILDEPGKPMLPVYRSTFTFSRNVKIKSISCDYSNIIEKRISGKIIPGPELIPYSKITEENSKPIYIEDEDIYENDALYPDNWYEYSIHCGLNSEEVPTTFVNVELHPVRYSPNQNMLHYMTDFTIHVSYEDPGYKKNTNAETYDLVIIAPSVFSNDLQPLVDHKNSKGMKTMLKTTEEIFSSYSGRDEPEKVKYFIKEAKETMDITYVLLVGGIKGYLYARDRDDTNHGSDHWYCPVRYAHIKNDDELSCISDLYYGDLYRYNEDLQEWEFEDWDYNGDGIFAYNRGFGQKKDKLDLVPDVYYGRLPCRNKLELKILVRKIMVYESSSPNDKPWLKKMIGVGGRTHEIYQGQPDGEFTVDMAFQYMENFTNEEVRVYASNEGTGKPEIPEDIIPEITKGAGFVLFEGHGNPGVWDTHPVHTNDEWLGSTKVDQFYKLFNLRELPIVVVGGCHNALFNISIIQVLLNRKDHYNWYWLWTPTPVCFSWGFCIVPWGGAIACMGCTGYGFGRPGTYSSALETGFFYQIGQNGTTHLGESHSGAIRDYFMDNKVNQFTSFATTIWQLFGDPSLKLGGY